jgi:hypothetical protein
MPGPSRGAIVAEREQVISQVDRDKTRKVGEIRSAMSVQASEASGAFQERIGQMQEAKANISDKISSLQSALGEIPPGHPQRAAVEKQIAMLRKQLAQIEANISAIKFRKSSQLKMINFQKNMREQMININHSKQKAMILQRFAEKLMQFEQMQIAMKARSGGGEGGVRRAGAKPGMGNSKEAGQASG